MLDGTSEVARHERSWARHQVLESPAHRASLIADKRRARDLKGRDRLHAEIPGIDRLLDRWAQDGRSLGSRVAFTLTLLDGYGPALLREVVADMLARGLHDKGAMAILCEQRRKDRRAPPPSLIQLGAHVVERDVIPHDLGGYDE
jgi:hypothetical protein